MGSRPELGKLKPGPGLPAEVVVAHQQRRLHRALIDLVDEGGYEGLTVRALAGRAGVSSRSFYRQFENVDDCLGSTYAAVMGDALARSLGAQRAGGEWQPALRAGVATLMESFAADPRAARLVLVEVFASGPVARQRVSVAFGELEQLLATSLAASPCSLPAPRHLVAGMAAGIIRVARKTALARRCDELPGLTDQVVGWMLSLPDPELLRLQLGPPGDRPARRREPEPFPSEPGRTVREIDGDERGRLLRAAAKLAAADGFPSLTAPRIRAEAGVSRRRFDASFADVRDCFLQAVATVATGAATRAQAWAVHVDGWERRTSKAVLALAAQVARDRGLARLTFSEIYAAGREGLVRREEIVTRAAAALRETIPAEQRPSELAVEASIAAAWHIAHADAVGGRARNLPAIAPLLSYVVLAPIVGARTAAVAIQAEIGVDALPMGRA